MTYYLGGQTITKAGWLGPNAVYLDFEAIYTSGWLWQLYANRTLIGSTSDPGQRRIIGSIEPSDSPAPLTLVRVDAANVLTDYGPQLPRLPWNRFALQWLAESYPADAHHFEITGSTAADGAVDPANVVANVPYTLDGSYQFMLPPFAAAGVWTYSIAPHDDAIPSGNAGDSEEVAITVAVPPPDVQFAEDGTRLTGSITGGVLTAGFSW